MTGSEWQARGRLEVLQILRPVVMSFFTIPALNVKTEV